MLNFVQNIQYYMMFEVMEPTWHIMENNLKSVSGTEPRLLPTLIAFSAIMYQPIATCGVIVLCLV